MYQNKEQPSLKKLKPNEIENKNEENTDETQAQNAKQSVGPKKCIHICEKKKRQCKFIAMRGTDYCIEHLSFSSQV
jgi:hypothetical protein